MIPPAEGLYNEMIPPAEGSSYFGLI
jgi:hypothetical protein